MTDPDRPDPEFDAMTARLLRREALRRAARGIDTTSGPGLENMLAQISDEVTAEAANRVSREAASRDLIGRCGPDSPIRRR